MPLLASALDTVRPAAEAKQIEVETTIDATDAEVNGDSARLQQVFWNLLTNAVSYTPRGGRVYVHVGTAEGQLRVTVRDTGVGISPDFLPHVFERFRQAESTWTRPQGGLGLGLAIVHHIVELHGGHITAASDGIGHGATFVVTLPCAPAPARLSGGAPARSHQAQELRCPSRAPRHGTRRCARAGRIGPARARRHRDTCRDRPRMRSSSWPMRQTCS